MTALDPTILIQWLYNQSGSLREAIVLLVRTLIVVLDAVPQNERPRRVLALTTALEEALVELETYRPTDGVLGEVWPQQPRHGGPGRC